MQRVSTFLEDDKSILYCLFLTSVLPLFEEGNLQLQQEEPVIHSMHAILTQQLKNLLIWFMKPNVVSTNMEALSSINLSRENQVSDEKLFIGSAARAYIAEHKTLTSVSTISTSSMIVYVISLSLSANIFVRSSHLKMSC